MYSPGEREEFEQTGRRPDQFGRLSATRSQWSARRRLRVLAVLMLLSPALAVGNAASGTAGRVYAYGLALLSVLASALCWAISRPGRPAPVLVGMGIGAAASRMLWGLGFLGLFATSVSTVVVYGVLLPGLVVTYIVVNILRVAREPVAATPS